jgi:hypothetical protein
MVGIACCARRAFVFSGMDLQRTGQRLRALDVQGEAAGLDRRDGRAGDAAGPCELALSHLLQLAEDAHGVARCEVDTSHEIVLLPLGLPRPAAQLAQRPGLDPAQERAVGVRSEGLVHDLAEPDVLGRRELLRRLLPLAHAKASATTCTCSCMSSSEMMPSRAREAQDGAQHAAQAFGALARGDTARTEPRSAQGTPHSHHVALSSALSLEAAECDWLLRSRAAARLHARRLASAVA